MKENKSCRYTKREKLANCTKIDSSNGHYSMKLFKHTDQQVTNETNSNQNNKTAGVVCNNRV
jgi:hypothetical protein